MENLNMNKLLDREHIFNEIKTLLEKTYATTNNNNNNNSAVKKGFYIYGHPGSGKSEFIISMLKKLNYDIIKYDAGDIRNKSIIDTIAKHNMADRNIMSMFEKQVKKIVIVMDEIDGMNNGDKGGINSLIKLIRPKKTKKQKCEESTVNPIICIGNYHMDKKIKELMKVCNTFELKTPTPSQIKEIICNIMPLLDSNLTASIIQYINGDLQKLLTIYNIYKQHRIHSGNVDILNCSLIKKIFQPNAYSEDSKQITHNLLNKKYSIDQHATLLNETDRTIVGLLWHENIIDLISKHNQKDAILFYKSVLSNICFADYIDRITFQKQIWQFNEMSSLIKTFYNNKLYHEHAAFKKKVNFNYLDVRFTKVLTKYSTEYNNTLFIQNLCQRISMDKKDLFYYFLTLKYNNYNEDDIYKNLETCEIMKIDINRMFRYLDNVGKDHQHDNANSADADADADAAADFESIHSTYT